MNGIINLYKEQGFTSFSAVAAVRRLTSVSKCGHLGTLDPMAEGVLPLCLGYATRFADYLSAVNKEYIAQFKLGLCTDSFDITGKILSENIDIIPSNEDLNKVFQGFVGETSLEVPAFSAKKINGVRAYKLARSGSIESAGSATMEIISCDLIHYEYPFGIIKVNCGKGTYIRSIIAEVGKICGCGAVMSGLVRTVNGVFKSSEAYKISDLEEMKNSGRLEEAIIPVTKLLNWGRAVIKDETLKLVCNGNSPLRNGYLSFPSESENDNFFIEDKSGKLLAIGRGDSNMAIPIKITMVFK